MRDEEALPANWLLVPLAELLTGIETGKSFKCDERPPKIDEVGVVKVSAVSWGAYQEQESKTCMDNERINSALFVHRGDFLFSRANTIELVGACVIAQQVKLRVMLSDKILRFRFVSDSMKPWVLSLLRSMYGRQQIEALASGNQDSMRNIGQERIGQILVPLPPSAEQTRIVDKLEELLSDLDAGVAELKAAQNKLAQYRQSLLKAAVEGQLTEAWRAQHGEPEESGAQLLARILRERRALWEAKQLAKFEARGKAPGKGWQDRYVEPGAPDPAGLNELPRGWTWASVEQLSIEQRYGTSAKTGEIQPGVPVIRMGNIQDGELDFDKLKYLPIEHDEFPELYLTDGEMLFNRTNSAELVGKSAVYRSQMAPCSYASYLIGVRFSSSVVPELVAAYVNSSFGRQWVKSVVTQQVGQANVNGSKLAALAVPLPPVREQIEISQRLDEQKTLAAEQLDHVTLSLRQSAAQRKNILQAAFSGQLVPQDPNDEPASVLLARIRAEREGRPAKPRKPRAAKASA